MPTRVAQKPARDWRGLTDAHRRRGALITVFFDPDSAALAPAERVPGKNGRPRLYTDEHIEALLTVKLLLRLSLRAVQGFAAGMARIACASWAVPDYSTLSRRQAGLEVDLGAALAPGKKHVLLVDSTGLKVFGAGEWKVRMHGTEGKRRTWRKVHLLVDRESGAVVAVETTPGDVGDATVVPALLPADMKGDFLLGDGAYHSKPLHRSVHAKGGTLLSPPPKDAMTWRERGRKEEPALAFRNRQLTHLQRLGRTPWKVQSGYSQRSFVECTNNRLKSITGDKLAARTLARQKVEVRLRCKALNSVAVPGKRLAA
jgi:IS5 family transposase